MKKRLTKKFILFTLIFNVVVFGVAMNFFVPGLLYDGAVNATRFVAGLKAQKADVDGYHYAYLDTHPKGSNLPVLVALHGFTGDKDNWARMAVFLRGKYRLIFIDMLGHGDSDKPLEDVYALSDQANRLNSLMQELGINKFHLAGNSMGGQTAGIYASMFPNKMLSVIFVNNAGITSPEKSLLLKKYEESGRNDLIVKKPEEVASYFDAIFDEPPFMTKQIALFLGKQMADKRLVHEKILQNFVFDKPEPLEPLLPSFAMPVQIIWGDQDKVLDVSSVEVMAGLLNTEKVHVFKGIGHAPMLESPKATADIIHQFIQNIKSD